MMLILWTVLVGVAAAHEDRECNHRYPRHTEVIHGVHLEDKHTLMKRNANQNLRIKLFYDDSVFRLTQEKFNLINDTILPEAVQYWEKALRVRRSEATILLNRKCEDNQVFYKKGEQRPYCKNQCEPVTMCGEVIVPEQHLDVCRVCNSFGQNCEVVGDQSIGIGVLNADFVFYVSAMETERCHKGMTVAYAAHCQQESALDRPIAGHANLCPQSISTKSQDIETLLSTVKHEILHALGFSVSLYAFYRDNKGFPRTPRTPNGKPLLNEDLQARQWSENVIKTVVRPQWLVARGWVEREVEMIVTPRVVEEVRRHFNCSTLEGAELENQGHGGTALTHWEKRVFENEAMTGTHTQNPVYSRITLALMEDTGWYDPDYSLAQPLSWGRNLGCGFVMKSCMEWMQEREKNGERLHPFCNQVKRDPLRTECTEDRSSVALCNLVEHSVDLPYNYRNFEFLQDIEYNDVTRYGGSVALADYCPYIQEFTWKSNDVVIRGSHCNFDENNPVAERNFALERYGGSSRCFEHGSMWEERSCNQVRQWQHWGSGCYEFQCSNGRLYIDVNNHTLPCYYAGQELVIQQFANSWLHTGSVICPACVELCDFCITDTLSSINFTYERDFLRCSSSCLVPWTVVILTSIVNHVLLR